MIDARQTWPKCPHCGETRPHADYDWLRYHEEPCHIETLQREIQSLSSKLEQALEQREEALAAGADLKVELAGVTGRLEKALLALGESSDALLKSEARLDSYEKWFRDNAVNLAVHNIGGYSMSPQNFTPMDKDMRAAIGAAGTAQRAEIYDGAVVEKPSPIAERELGCAHRWTPRAGNMGDQYCSRCGLVIDEDDVPTGEMEKV